MPVSVPAAVEWTHEIQSDSYGREVMAASPYEGADSVSREMAFWHPGLTSAAYDIELSWRELAARTRDLYRNNGQMRGTIQSKLDNLIGGHFRLNAKPDWRMLGQSAGWASEWARIIEPRFNAWAYDTDHWIDASRTLNLAGILNQGMRSVFLCGDLLNVAKWKDDRPRQIPRTAIKTVAAERLCNPYDRMDTERLRSGIEYDFDGAPIAYHIRQGHEYDTVFSAASGTWIRVPKETPWGRRQVIHLFDQEHADQPRGVTEFAGILRKARMFDRWDRAQLEAAIINSIFAAVFESELSTDSVLQALGSDQFGTEKDTTQLGRYLKALAQYHSAANIRFNGAKIPHTFPGEKFNFTTPNHPAASHDSYTKSFDRHFASALGVTEEFFSGDYSRTNYSGARSGFVKMWQGFRALRLRFPAEQATMIYALWLEEEMDRDASLRPRGAPAFWDAKSAWCRSLWMGPPQEHVDPLKEEASADMKMKAARGTLEDYYARLGQDWEEKLAQIAEEQRVFKELGIKVSSSNVTVNVSGDGE